MSSHGERKTQYIPFFACNNKQQMTHIRCHILNQFFVSNSSYAYSLLVISSVKCFCSPDACWTLKMSSAISRQTLCPWRCVIGWPPPSPGRWVWCADAPKRSPGSAVSFTPFKPGSSLNGIKSVYTV